MIHLPSNQTQVLKQEILTLDTHSGSPGNLLEIPCAWIPAQTDKIKKEGRERREELKHQFFSKSE